MPRNRNAENPVRAAMYRKWYARAWWVGLHAYGYVVLGVQGALSPHALPIYEFVVYLIVAVATTSCYVCLQLSSPGQLVKRPMLTPVQAITPLSNSNTLSHMAIQEGDDAELLGDGEHSRSSVNLHFCHECHVFQPLRTYIGNRSFVKNIVTIVACICSKDCARCTRQYDHHCDCVGTCVGGNNRRLFLLFLILQTGEAAIMIDVTSQAFSERDDVKEWLQTNALYIVLWFCLLCVLLMVLPLLCYQIYLISTNQTSWEHARRHSITYLQHLPDKRSPFDRGILQNWVDIITNGDRNNWVHSSVPNPMTVPPDTLVVMTMCIVLGVIMLIAWICAPIFEAKRRAEELEPMQEASFQDPTDYKHLPFGSLGDEKAEVALTVVIPAYNEEHRIRVTIEDTVAFFEAKKESNSSFSYEIIIVDDCSSDRTVNIVMQAVKKYSVTRIRLLQLQHNHGKGGAIRKGVMRARGERVLFADADNATKIQDYDKLATAMDEVATSHGVVVCGSRAHLEEQAIAKRNALRNLLMHGFHMIVSTLCIENVRDTQCGFKLFDRTAARVLFAPLHIERWAFDVELLYLAASRDVKIKEVAVQWQEVPGSKLSVVSATITMLREIILIRFCYSVGIWKNTDGGFRLANRPAGL
ncbi:hypothetical protein CCR75_008089 [Bremia lactucae]|uniref:Palmitoyltransferase n=1 Tax=Bremia lactucae TaxID=4779 RepID=A0A976IKH6_BRELC|nr:hypothetical protein CCR75_008089 [Bremia lactucae]